MSCSAASRTLQQNKHTDPRTNSPVRAPHIKKAMKVTARSTVSTLSVILGVCITPTVAIAQASAHGAPPTAGFADPTPEQQRLLGSDTPAGGGSVTTVTPAQVHAFSSGNPAYANAAPPRYTYTAPPAYPYSPRPSPVGYRYSDGAQSGTSDARADASGGGSTTDRPQKEEHFRIGVLGGLGFPRALAVEGMVKLEKVLGLGLEYATTPNYTVSGAETSFWALSATLRVFPFKDGFFLGLRGGRQHLGGEGTITVAPYGRIHESVAIDTTFLNPRIGFLWTWSPGFTLGIDAGVQIPIGVTVASSVPPGTGVDQEVLSVAQTIGNSPLPTIDLLKLGFLL
jgi:hypothetical protein